VSASRAVGSAVVRNRAKRRLRAALRERTLPTGVDVVVVAHPSAVTAPWVTVRHELDALTTRALERTHETAAVRR